MDVFINFSLTTNGFWNWLPGLNKQQSYHVVWYLSIVLFLVMAYNVKIDKGVEI